MPKRKKNANSTEKTMEKTTESKSKTESRVEPALPAGVLNVLMSQVEVEGLVDLLRITAIVYDSSRKMAEQSANLDAAAVNSARAELARHYLNKFQAVSDIGEPESRYNH